MIGELFDPQAELAVDSHYRPHWSQSGAVVFVTFRTRDSIPREVIARWQQEKREWLSARGVDAKGDLNSAAAQLEPEDAKLYRKHFNRQREICLDECLGACVLKRPEVAKIVSDSLLHFVSDRYRMGDFVIMPNHVHLLAAFSSQDGMRKQFDSWLHWTAVQINRKIGSSGRFWQEEPFDHLVRSNDQYEYLRDYIRDNPKKAGLGSREYVYRRVD